jgi:hypothetical protein
MNIYDIEVGNSEDGPFRSYFLSADGDTLDALLESAVIFEVDQDGEECVDYPIGDYSTEIYERCVSIIKNRIENG